MSTEKTNAEDSAAPLCYLVWELAESEYWDDGWDHIGLFTSLELAEQTRAERETMLRETFDESVGDFADWYSWSITKRELSGNSGQLVTK